MSKQPYDPQAHPYPAWRYHAEHGETLVENAEEEATLGPGWVDTPNVPEGFLRDCGESGESKTQRVGEVDQVCKAFDQRLKKRVSREAVSKNTPLWRVSLDSLKEELKELAFGVIKIYLKYWDKCKQSVDNQKDKWFREGLLEYVVKEKLENKLQLLKRDHAKQRPSRQEADQRGEQWDKVGASVCQWVREQVLGELRLPQASESKEKGRKKKPGPKGPRKTSASRRTAIKLLKQEGFSGLEACKKLKDMKIPLPSERLQILHGKYDWVQWFNFDPKAFHKQWSADLKRPSF